MAFPLALANLEAAVLDACAREGEWPAQVAAGIYAGVDYAIANPEVAETLASEDAPGTDVLRRYERVIGRLAGFLRVKAPADDRLPGATDEALVAGVVGLVGDHLRIGRLDRLEELRPELVLLTLLPYLGFAEAKRWADEAAK
ncbi:MAG: hypothetical protein ACJ76B_11810 [Solirubrobacterales bacterium]